MGCVFPAYSMASEELSLADSHRRFVVLNGLQLCYLFGKLPVAETTLRPDRD